MKRNLIILTVVGALLALAAPASSMAANFGMFPAGHKFEIKAQATGAGAPLISGPLAGYCEISKITGTVPAAPNNESTGFGSLTVHLAQPTLSCGSGMSGTVGGEWSMIVFSGSLTRTSIPTGGLTFRYSSLPGCKLVPGTGYLLGTWINGSTSPLPSHSGFAAAALRNTSGVDWSTLTFNWQKDGTSACALEGKTEALAFRTNGNPGSLTSASAVVTDTTNPAENIILTGGF